MLSLSEDARQTIESVIRERFAGKVDDVEIEMATDERDDDILLIRVVMAKDVTADDFSGRFFGLTGRVRTAVGEELRDVFPVIRPVEAHA